MGADWVGGRAGSGGQDALMMDGLLWFGEEERACLLGWRMRKEKGQIR